MCLKNICIGVCVCVCMCVKCIFCTYVMESVLGLVLLCVCVCVCVCVRVCACVCVLGGADRSWGSLANQGVM